MSYSVATSCFKENIALTGGANNDPVSFNLYNGLFQLTQQLQRDNADLMTRLRKIEQNVDYLTSR